MRRRWRHKMTDYKMLLLKYTRQYFIRFATEQAPRLARRRTGRAPQRTRPGRLFRLFGRTRWRRIGRRRRRWTPPGLVPQWRRRYAPQRRKDAPAFVATSVHRWSDHDIGAARSGTCFFFGWFYDCAPFLIRRCHISQSQLRNQTGFFLPPKLRKIAGCSSRLAVEKS